jgi:hypothetical protein
MHTPWNMQFGTCPAVRWSDNGSSQRGSADTTPVGTREVLRFLIALLTPSRQVDTLCAL